MKLYVIWSTTFNNLIGVYSDREQANKIAESQSAKVIETELDRVHALHHNVINIIQDLVMQEQQVIAL